jgi:hypothetical protein
VYVAAWSKKTLSATVGTEAPPPPPEVADQLVVDDVFQVPVPPTQYLLAIVMDSLQWVQLLVLLEQLQLHTTCHNALVAVWLFVLVSTYHKRLASSRAHRCKDTVVRLFEI